MSIIFVFYDRKDVKEDYLDPDEAIE